jgi:hypothetical protein
VVPGMTDDQEKEHLMSEHFFDVLLRRASTTASRRGIVGALAGLTLGELGSTVFGSADAEAKHHHHKNKKKQRRRKRQKNDVATAPPPPLDCIASCTGNVCGDDGCGGSCGSCGAVSCSNGVCDCTGQPDGTDCGSGGQCIAGVCTPPPVCIGLLGACSEDGDCCSAFCQGTGQCACSEPGEACHTRADCCQFPAEQNCVNFVCVAS